ncbi:ATP-binding protein [Variovorax sp. YR566]|uniref:ATP-binding protein n=1 Tax=Variovorax sp. YR566 TaxID=3450237 RepID=UPI003F7E916D
MAALRRNLPFALLGVMPTVALVIAALYRVVPHAQLATRAAANAVLTAARGWGAWCYRVAEDGAALHRWRRCTLAGTALLDRILRNLVDNAIRHTKHGGVLVGCRRAGNALRVEVWDAGPGIPPEA